MWQSNKPGMTVRPPSSTTCVFRTDQRLASSPSAMDTFAAHRESACAGPGRIERKNVAAAQHQVGFIMAGPQFL